jgi:DNA-binding beta-propeller fold protein YncE
MRRLSTGTLVALTVAACAVSPGPSTPPAPTASTFPDAAPASGTPSAAVLPAGVVSIIPVAGGPIGLAATTDSIWVENHRTNSLSRIDPAENVEAERLDAVPVHCDVAAGGGFVWTTQASGGIATKVDPESGETAGEVLLPEACGVAADDEDVWIVSPGAGTVVRYDPETLEERASIPLGDMSFWVAIGPEAVWAAGEADGGTLWRIDPETNTVVASISVPNPFSTGVEVGHGSVWVPARDNKVIYRIDPATNEVATTIQMPSAIGGIGVGPDAVWSSGFGDGKVYRIDPATNEVTGSIDTGLGNLGPPLVAFDSVWVGALDRNVVARLDPEAAR